MKKVSIMAGVILFSITLTSSISAKEEERKAANPASSAKVIYRNGYLENIGQEPALRCEVTAPFYKFIGDISPARKIDISYIKTKFTISYLVQDWLGGYREAKETFSPQFKYKVLIAPEVKIECRLKGRFLEIEIISNKPLKNAAIEILPEVPVRISESRVRYITSQVLALGQNVVYGQKAEFEIISLSEDAYSVVPVQISYQYHGIEYQKLVFYSFKNER
ncbi:MAG: hypothetical protein ABIH08_03605 [Candidatus Omnitrophota bacterium]